MLKRYLLFCLLIFGLFEGWAIAQKKYANLQEALFSGRKLRGSNGPQSVNWINGGTAYSFMTSENVIKSFNPTTGKEETILDASSLKFTDGSAFEFESFQFSKDSKYLMFQTKFRPIWRHSGISDYYYYSITDKKLQLVAKDANTAELSPDGKKVGFERNGNLFVYEFAGDKTTQLTQDAQNQVYNGRFGWVYEEEFGLVQAWLWSPDSKYIAYWQTDEREVPIYQITDYSGKHPQYMKIPYPKVGDKNPSVKIGVIDVASNTQKWMDLEVGDNYVPRLYWTSQSGQLALQYLNRKQNHLKLYFFEALSGKGKMIMEEKSATWIDIYDFFTGSGEAQNFLFFPNNSQEFFWISDRDGWNHIYRYDYSGKLLNQVTKGNWEVEVMQMVDANKKMIYYTSTEASPLERQLYGVSFDGKKKIQLTKTAGRHYINFSSNGQTYIDRYSNVNLPTQVELWSVNGKKIKDLETNNSVKDFVKSNFYASRELMSFTTSDGQKLDIYVIKPANFDQNKKYPMILNIYGGPGSQSVYNQFGTDGWEQYLAQDGYVVVSVNNRGSGAYGAKFKKIVYANLGEWESKDFVETANFMASLPYIDKNKIAIRGHSYGGYMSSLTTLKYPDVFKVALVGAPVTDWRLYDSIYTERYMGLLGDNEAKYASNSPINYAAGLKNKMLIAHSTMDDNVHVQNTFQLVKALIDKGKDADLRIYPPGAHGVAYDATSYVLLYSQYMDYLQKYLKN
jgi:dipeptidyl-peptidase-4